MRAKNAKEVAHWFRLSMRHFCVLGRNRRVLVPLSPVLIHFHSPSSFLYQKLQQLLQQDPGRAAPSLLPVTHWHPGPAKPQHGIPAVEWPSVLCRVIENQEPLREVADDYAV